MARSREFNPDDVLQVAVTLFWEKGYFDSSVDEVVRRSGVAKYGIYGVFGSKHELFKKALRSYAADRHKDIQAPLRQPGAALPEILHFFDRAVDMMTGDAGPRGCLIVNSGVELGLRDPAIRDFVTEFFRETADVMEGCLKNAVSRGQLADTGNLRELATYLVTEFRTALMLSGSGCSRGQIRAHLQKALEVLE